MRTISLDTSSKRIAYAVWDDGHLTEYGASNIEYTGEMAIGHASFLIVNLFAGGMPDSVVYESSFLGKDPNMLTKLSKIHGAVIGAFYLFGVDEIYSVVPITWQKAIGVPATSRDQIARMKDKHPDKSMSWVRSKDRQNRKQRIIDIVNEHFNLELTMKENDVADAIGIGWFWHGLQAVV